MMQTDLTLYTAVSAALRAALGDNAAAISVGVRDGIVTLEGMVRMPAEKLAAQRAAQQVSGVHAVADELKIRRRDQDAVSDEQLARDLVDALNVGLHPIGQRITIAVSHGWVIVGGVVQSPAEYAAVERALECVGGVRGVTSELRIEPGDGVLRESRVSPAASVDG
jgi:osmotically-inducible protein OsmY